jgi:hypothetical protein
MSEAGEWSKTLLMPATEPVFRAGINASTAIANNRLRPHDTQFHTEKWC